ncbi:hypothetical protein JYG23_09930 [Sedimentibacter sp. zth1]|uniref:hypothetical protein n=1 Tax=Sedimentibacter sp. zth1 TaxID=2816908 RepID=UPI001A92A7CE|nr:hypothetical protein [Sedimentibacter sp. zth1]QSX05006.1 hypothetical protein JYG23_09930 [Sedimentibacter sp. zth1]
MHKDNYDLEKPAHYLKPSKKKIESKGIDTVISRVINISDMCKAVTIYKLENSLKKSFENTYGIITKYKIYDTEDLNI